MEKQQRPNFYLLLELSYDPPETDDAVIAEAISNKQRYWNSNANNPRKTLEINRNRQLIPDIKRVMLESPSERLEEAKQAKEIILLQGQVDQKSKMEELKRAISLLCLSDNVTEAGLRAISQQTGITYDVVVANLPKNTEIQKDVAVDKQKNNKIDEIKISKMNDFLAHLQIQASKGTVVTLYDFLDLTEDVESQKVFNLASKMYNDSLRKPKSSKADAQKELCSYVKTIFKDETEREKYDNTIQYLRFAKIESLIDLLGSQGMVNAVAFEELKANAVEQGITEEKAEQMLKDYCESKNYSLYLYSDTVAQSKGLTTIKCGHCLYLNDIDAKRCQKCGGALFKKCIECSSISPSTAKNCVQCGISFAQMTKYKELLLKGKDAYILKDLQAAEQDFLKAKLLIETDEINVMLNKIQRKKDEATNVINEASKLMQEKKYYKAQAVLEKIHDLTIDDSQSKQLKQQIDRVIESLDQRYSEIMKIPINDRTIPIVNVLNICGDCPWALTMIESLPPLPPTDLVVDVVDDKAILKWTQAEVEGLVTYKIYRTEVEKPSRLFEGTMIVETEKAYFEDTKIEPAVNYWYSIYTYRLNLRAPKVSVFGPISRFIEVPHFDVSLKESAVHIHWDLPKNLQFVLVKAEGKAPKTIHDGTVIARGNDNFFKDINVEVGKEYGYSIFTVAEKNGTEIISNGVSKQITIIDAKSIQDIVVTFEENVALLSWTNAENTPVKLYKNSKQFSYQVGQCVPLVELDQALMEAPTSNLTPTTATIQNIANQGEYILPVSIVDRVAVIGQSVFVKQINKVKQIEIKQSQEGLQISFVWPVDVQTVVICYGEQKFEGQNSEHKIVVDEQTFRKNQGIRIPITQNTAYYFSIFSRFKKDGKHYFSAAEHTYFSTEKPFDMSYFTYKKGLFKKKYFLYIILDKQQPIIPGFRIVKKKGSQPLHAEDGQMIFQLDTTILNDATILPTGIKNLFNSHLLMDVSEHADSKVFIRIFFNSSDDAKRFILTPIGKVELK